MSRSKEPGFSLITGEAEVAFADESPDAPRSLATRIERSGVHAGGRLSRRHSQTHPTVLAELAMLAQLESKMVVPARVHAPAATRS